VTGPRRAFDLDELSAEREAWGRLYLEFLRVPALSVGLYELAAGATDPQGPHSEDEVYVVMSGAAVLRVAEVDHPVAAGSVVHVEAGAEHRFVDITSDLTVLVVFAPPEGSAATG
jgi:quercetin dioxygenase-like cupin family protein